jgi:ABC-2 type transport system ATP-binding protein
MQDGTQWGVGLGVFGSLRIVGDMQYALEISDLRKTYKNNFEALKGIDLCVERGDFFALLGPNGAGKSTTLGILSALVKKSSGQVKVCGLDQDKDPEGVKRKLGVVPQEFNFNQFERVHDILMQQAGYYGMRPDLARVNIEKYLRQMELWDKRFEKVYNLSGGMKRRLMIVRGLIHEPEVLILDEPTAGVDIEIRRSMWSFLTEINRQGVTIILTTHYLEEAEQLCRNVAIIHHGDILTHTSIRELLRRQNTTTFVAEVVGDLSPVLAAHPDTMSAPEPGELRFQVQRGDDLNAVFRILDGANIQVLSVRPSANRLESLFVDLVAKSDAAKESV